MAEDTGTQDRSQVIAHFQELTGVEDHGRCVEILSQHQWNLEAAIQDTLNEREGIDPIFNTPPPEVTPTQPSLRQRVVGQRAETVPIRAHPVERRQPQGWWDWLVSLTLLPIRLTVITATDLYQFLMNLMFGMRPAVSQNPAADAQLFLRELEQSYGTQHPVFLESSYDQAVSRAREELQFLLVYLHSPGHKDTPVFCREVLCSEEFTEFVNGKMLVWGASLNTQEGARTSYILRESTYPFLALIVLKQSRLIVVERIEGYLPRQVLIQKLQTAITNNEAELIVERNERYRRVADQQLREDQDAAYQESLAADREKERRRQEQLEREQTLAAAAEEREKEQRKLEEEFEIDRAVRSSRLAAEPDPSDPSAITVMLRLPSGYRLERRFLATDKLESVYDFAYTDDSGQLPRKFTLVTNFPRKELRPDSNGGPELQELDLGKRCALYVNDDTEN